MTLPSLTRRRLLFAVGGRLVAAGAAAGALNALVFPGDSEAIDWDALFRTMVTGGFATVKRLDGRAFAGKRALKVEDRVNSGETLRCTKDSRLFLYLSDDTALRLTGETELLLKVDNRGRGILHLLFGSVLAAVPMGNRYLVMGPTATVGIKGTVFYRELFPETMDYGLTPRGERVQVPPDSRDYFCTCHGDVEYLHPGTLALVFADHAEYHSAYFLNLKMPDMRKMALHALNHTDPDIRELARFQERRRVDLSWLRG